MLCLLYILSVLRGESCPPLYFLFLCMGLACFFVSCTPHECLVASYTLPLSAYMLASLGWIYSLHADLPVLLFFSSVSYIDKKHTVFIFTASLKSLIYMACFPAKVWGGGCPTVQSLFSIPRTRYFTKLHHLNAPLKSVVLYPKTGRKNPKN